MEDNMRRAFFMISLFLMIGLIIPPLVLLSATLENIEHSSNSQNTMIIFEFDEHIDLSFRVHSLIQPERLYFDLPNTNKITALSEYVVYDDRLQRIRLGFKDPDTLRIVFEINNYKASEIEKSFKSIDNKLYFIVAEPGHQINIDQHIEQYITGFEEITEDDLIKDDPFEIDPFTPADKTETDVPVIDIDQIEDKPEETIKMNDEKESIRSFLPESVSLFLFHEIFPNFYTLYLLIILFLIIILMIIMRKKKRRKESDIEHDSIIEEYPEEDEEADNSAIEGDKNKEPAFGDFLNTETRNIRRDLSYKEDRRPFEPEENHSDNNLFDNDDDIIETAELVEEEEEEEEIKSKEPEKDLFDYKPADPDKRKVLTEEKEKTEKPASSELEQEIENSLGIFDEAKNNTEDDQEEEIMIKLDEKELRKKREEESLEESMKYYPLNVGNGWVWKYKNSLRKRMVIGRKDLQGKGEVYKIKETVRIGEHKKQTIWYVYKSEKGIIEKADQYKIKILAFPIQMNKKWEDDTNTYEIVGMNESINNFDNCLKIMVSPKDIPIKRYNYFKKGIGLIMDEAKEELIKYKIDGKEYSINNK